MFEQDTLIGSIINGVKEHSQSFGILGVITGALLVIYYCGSINFYPSGLTITDALFFLWATVIFGIYYTISALSFFTASIFWVYTFAKPINYLNKIKNKNIDIIVPFPKNDKLFTIGAGLFFNIAIIGISLLKGHSLLAIISAFIIIGFLYTLIENISKTRISGSTILDSNGNPPKSPSISPNTLKGIFYVIIYVAPLFIAQIGGGVTKITFEKMGIRQQDVDIVLNPKGIKSSLQSYKKDNYINEIICNDECILKGVNILFTGIGSNSKLQSNGKNGSIEFEIPSKNILLISKKKQSKTNPKGQTQKATTTQDQTDTQEKP